MVDICTMCGKKTDNPIEKKGKKFCSEDCSKKYQEQGQTCEFC